MVQPGQFEPVREIPLLFEPAEIGLDVLRVRR
jgi:hypothetical protein